MKHLFIILFLSHSLVSCEQTNAPIHKEVIKTSIPSEKPIDYTKSLVETRDTIISELRNKTAKNLPLVVHVLVPLCDNEHQGIVPTSASLGNGMDLKHNLYWATSKGMKRYFNELPDWKLLVSHLDPTDEILERVIFQKHFKNGPTVYLVADAYRGDKMVDCLNDYFNSLAGTLKDSATIDGVAIGINGNADLIAFNGHNGLMDESTEHNNSIDGKPRDAVAIACASGPYFRKEYIKTHSYPLVTTTNLLYPGAFILEGIINKWAQFNNAEECKIAAGKSYYKHKPKSGPNGSQNLFDYGW